MKIDTENRDMDKEVYYFFSVASILVLLLTGIYFFNNRKTYAPAIKKAGNKNNNETIVYPANYYASSDALTKAKSGTFRRYADIPYSQWMLFYNKGKELFGQEIGDDGKGEKIDYRSAKIQGWLKGMDLALSPEHVVLFRDDIANYLHSSSPIPHWSISVGEFLNK